MYYRQGKQCYSGVQTRLKVFSPTCTPMSVPLSCVSMPQVPREHSQEAVIFPQAAAASHDRVQGAPFVVKQECRDAPITPTLPLTEEPRVGAMVDAEISVAAALISSEAKKDVRYNVCTAYNFRLFCTVESYLFTKMIIGNSK